MLNNLSLNFVAKSISIFQVCNAVAVAALLNATLVLPRFLYSSVWKDTRYRTRRTLLVSDFVPSLYHYFFF
jgi:hypothetical protein